MEYAKSIAAKPVAKKQPTDDTAKKSKPIISNDLCLKRTLKKPITRAKTTAATEEKVLTCPITPTSTPNSGAIVYRKRLIKTPSGPMENAQKTSVRSKPFLGEAPADIIET
jgi:hypothetical protein